MRVIIDITEDIANVGTIEGARRARDAIEYAKELQQSISEEIGDGITGAAYTWPWEVVITDVGSTSNERLRVRKLKWPDHYGVYRGARKLGTVVKRGGVFQATTRVGSVVGLAFASVDEAASALAARQEPSRVR